MKNSVSTHREEPTVLFGFFYKWPVRLSLGQDIIFGFLGGRSYLLSSLRLCCQTAGTPRHKYKSGGCQLCWRRSHVAVCQRLGQVQVCCFHCRWGVIWLQPADDRADWLLSARFSNSKTEAQLPPCFTIIIFCTDSLFWCPQTFNFCC